MTDREKLIGIVKSSLIKHIDKSCCLAENIVDDLLAENVTTLPVAFSDNRRERMIELLSGYYEETGLACVHYFTDEESEMLADYILADGWIRPPCKPGDTVFVIIETSCQNIDGIYTTCEFYKVGHEDLCTVKGKCPYRYRIAECFVDNTNLLKFSDQWNKTVFPLREEAEKALKEL